MSTLDCVFRFNPHPVNGGEVATCGLVKRITGFTDDLCQVGRDACVACSADFTGASVRRNPVLASLMYQSCEEYLSETGQAGLDHVARDGITRYV